MTPTNPNKDELAAGLQLAEAGSDLYNLADENVFLEQMDDFNKIMFLINKLSYKLI